jgi:hypothetical protein
MNRTDCSRTLRTAAVQLPQPRQVVEVIVLSQQQDGTLALDRQRTLASQTLDQRLLDDGIMLLREDADRCLAQGRHRVGDQLVERVVVGRLVGTEAQHLEGGAAERLQGGLAHRGAVTAVLHNGEQRLDELVSAAQGWPQLVQYLDTWFVGK